MDEFGNRNGQAQIPGDAPAFPVSIPGAGDNGWHGMSLRDWFAGQALLGILSGPASRDGVGAKEWLDAPQFAYRLADKMIELRKKEV